MPPRPVKIISYGDLEGGLARMMDRYRDEGTLTGDLEADKFIAADGNAALLGLLYDQRVRAEYAFTGPIRLKERLGHLNMKKISRMDSDEFRDLFAVQPAVHRFTNKMAEYTQQVAEVVSSEYAGKAENIWNDDSDFKVIQKRIHALPGFGKAKAMKMRFVLHYFGFRDFS